MRLQNDAKKSTWMNYLAKVITLSTIGLSVIGIIGYSVDLYRHGHEKHYIGWFSSAGFVLLTVPISVRLIVMHLTHWHAPNIQKYVVRIIWMIPIYSVESCFLYFLIALLGDEQQIIAKLKLKSPDHGRHQWPVNLVLAPWSMGVEFLTKCKIGVIQYVVVKNITAVMVCVFASYGLYHEGRLRFDDLWLYQCVACNVSQLWALYCMVQFYFATKEELAPWRPVGKFLAVKLVVFFTWWQSIAISMMLASSDYSKAAAEGGVPSAAGGGGGMEEAAGGDDLAMVDAAAAEWTVTEVGKGLQDYLICIEMFFASIAFTYAFTHKDYISHRVKDDGESGDLEESRPFLSAFLQSSVPDDMFADIRRFARDHGFSGLARKGSNENTSEHVVGTPVAVIPDSAGASSPSHHLHHHPFPQPAAVSKHSIELLRKDNSATKGCGSSTGSGTATAVSVGSCSSSGHPRFAPLAAVGTPGGAGCLMDDCALARTPSPNGGRTSPPPVGHLPGRSAQDLDGRGETCAGLYGERIVVVGGDTLSRAVDDGAQSMEGEPSL